MNFETTATSRINKAKKQWLVNCKKNTECELLKNHINICKDKSTFQSVCYISILIVHFTS